VRLGIAVLPALLVGALLERVRWFEFSELIHAESRVAVVYQERELLRRKCVRSSMCSLRGPPPMVPPVSLIGDGPRSRKPRSDRTARQPPAQRSRINRR